MALNNALWVGFLDWFIDVRLVGCGERVSELHEGPFKYDSMIIF
jgi:hypothetical protein